MCCFNVCCILNSRKRLTKWYQDEYHCRSEGNLAWSYQFQILSARQPRELPIFVSAGWMAPSGSPARQRQPTHTGLFPGLPAGLPAVLLLQRRTHRPRPEQGRSSPHRGHPEQGLPRGRGAAGLGHWAAGAVSTEEMPGTAAAAAGKAAASAGPAGAEWLRGRAGAERGGGGRPGAAPSPNGAEGSGGRCRASSSRRAVRALADPAPRHGDGGGHRRRAGESGAAAPGGPGR